MKNQFSLVAQSCPTLRPHGLVNYKLVLTKSLANDWTTKAFAICLYRDWTPCCYSCWPSIIPEGVQGGVRHSVLQGIRWDGILDSWMFLGTNFMVWIIASPHIQRSTKSLHGDIRSSWLTKPFCKMSASLHWNPPSPKLYISTFPPVVGSSLRAIWDAASWAAVLILPQIKLNSQLSSCTSFFLVHTEIHNSHI